MCRHPSVRTAGPVNTEQYQSGADDEEERTNRVKAPDVFLHRTGETGSGSRSRKVRTQQDQGTQKMKSSLQPVHVTPPVWALGCEFTATK